MGICERQHDLSANEKAIIERYRVAVYYCDNGYNIGAVISPEDQVKSVFKEMKANPHWKTSSIYIDSQNSRERAALHQMLKDAENHSFDILLAESAFSFSEDLCEAVNVIEQLQNAGVHVILLLEKINRHMTLSDICLKYLAAAAQSWATTVEIGSNGPDLQADKIEGE